MGMFLKRNGQRKEEGRLVLVFDVGSSSVSGTLLWTQASGVPKIALAFTEPIILKADISVDQLLSGTTKALNLVAGKIHKAGLGAPSRIFCVLSSPWYASETRVISLKKNIPFIFTTKLADSLIKKEVSLFESEQMKEYTEVGKTVRLIELKNIKTMLNGYETSEPLGEKSTELEMTIFISISPEQVLAEIEKVVMKHFHFKEMKFSSFAMASFAVVRDMYQGESDFLIVDVGGEVTDISMVKKNMLRESISFPLGSSFVVRQIANATETSPSEAMSFISLLKDGHASESAARDLEPTLAKIKDQWLGKFQESLSNLSRDISIPATIYLITDAPLVTFFSETIKTEQFSQYTLTESKFKIVILDGEAFKSLATFGGATLPGTQALIDSIYINRFLK